MDEEIRPAFSKAMPEREFVRWYWSKEDLEAACSSLDISRTGSKEELRERVAGNLGGRPTTPVKPISKAKSSVNWAKDELSRETIITKDISFGPNVRGFFKAEIGSRFVCHSEFMDWVRSNAGACLSDAVEAWHQMQSRKDNPQLRRPIAKHNNYLQYLQDFRQANPAMSFDEAKRCWIQKKLRPAQDGYVIFEERDLRFVGGKKGG
ncbi:MAG: DUF6434 domain-containing protein [Pseudomonadota bacterium]